MRSNEIHPVDAADLAAIDKAVYFIASMFLGTGQFDKFEQPELQLARKVADQMTAHYANGRKGMVYAVLPDGRSVLVPESYQAKENEMPKTYTDRSNAVRAAKKAGVDPEKIVKTDKGYEVPDAVAKAAKAAQAPKEPKAPKAPRAERAPRTAKLGQRAQIEADAAAGKLPSPLAITAPSDERHKKTADLLNQLAKDGDVDGLKAVEIKLSSSTPKRMDRYRNLAVMALEARAGQKQAV